MNRFQKILFWIFTIALGFVNPLISFALILLYYGKDILNYLGIQTNSENNDDSNSENESYDPSDLDRFWHPTWGFSSPKPDYDEETKNQFR